MYYIIEGGKRLEGTVNASGSKNASLPILAASILNSKTSTLYNIPNISDTETTQKILTILGCKVSKKNGKMLERNDIQNDELWDTSRIKYVEDKLY